MTALAAISVLDPDEEHSVALPPPATEVAADGAPHDEFPVTLDDAVTGGTRVKLRVLHC